MKRGSVRVKKIGAAKIWIHFHVHNINNNMKQLLFGVYLNITVENERLSFFIFSVLTQLKTELFKYRNLNSANLEPVHFTARLEK